jgi:hypothetical protein
MFVFTKCLGLACDLLYLPLKFSLVFSLLHVCCMPCSSSHICFYHPNSICWFVALCYMKESSRSQNPDYSYPIVLQLKLATLYWNNILALNYGSTQILRIFPLASVSRAALRPTQPPLQWVTGVLSQGGKARPGRDADHSPLLVPRSRMSSSYTSSLPWCLHGGSGAVLLYWNLHLNHGVPVIVS